MTSSAHKAEKAHSLGVLDLNVPRVMQARADELIK
jgi:hypothetical protein